MVTPVSFPFFTVSTNFLNPFLNTRRSAPCPRSPAPSALPPWHTPQTFRNHDRPSAIAFASPDRGFVAGTSDSARATELPQIGKHTSELQSQSNIVCRLLLEKKNRDRRLVLRDHWPPS